MTWRYQLTRQKVDGEDEYAIRELYIDPDGGKSWTRRPIQIAADSPEGISEILMRIRTDIKRGGVLDIPADNNERKEKP